MTPDSAGMKTTPVAREEPALVSAMTPDSAGMNTRYVDLCRRTVHSDAGIRENWDSSRKDQIHDAATILDSAEVLPGPGAGSMQMETPFFRVRWTLPRAIGVVAAQPPERDPLCVALRRGPRG